MLLPFVWGSFWLSSGVELNTGTLVLAVCVNTLLEEVVTSLVCGSSPFGSVVTPSLTPVGSRLAEVV